MNVTKMGVKDRAEIAAEYKRALDAKEVSEPEFKTLISDLGIEASFEADAAEYEQDIESHTLLVEILAIASLIPFPSI